jgi:hypothetical protein
MRRIRLLSLLVLSLCLTSGQSPIGLTYGSPQRQEEPVGVAGLFYGGGPALGFRSGVGNPRPAGAAAYSGGTGLFSNGPYDWVNSNFTYTITGAPPNVCGTLYTFRNGSQLIGPNWICTNSAGSATAGPWSGSSNQTDTNLYIQWPDGSRTSGHSFHVSDASPPTIWIDQPGGSGVPTAFSGGASDAQWGTGFNHCFNGWSSIRATFRNLSTGKYGDSSGYNNSSPVTFFGSVSPFCAYGFNVGWSVNTPPPSAHVSGNSYRWCVQTWDLFYNSNLACITFSG